MKSKQSGAALFVALIFLLVLTVIGVSSMSDTVMQGKMSAAVQDSQIALQGAETAVRAAELFIDALPNTLAFDTAAGLYTANNAPDPFVAATWIGTNSAQAGSVNGLAEQPRYFIELAGIVEPDDSVLSGTLGSAANDQFSSNTSVAFRIVARSTGGSSTASRLIESYYAKHF
jgi:type IV pilus assembly protein PilX